MKTLLAFASTHGCAHKCAEKLIGALDGETTVIDLKRGNAEDLGSFDAVVVGGSIHAGKVQRAVRGFCERNLDALRAKRLGLYLCCMEEGQKAEAQFDAAYPSELRAVAAARGLFGGEFDFNKMNWIEKSIVRKVSGLTASVSKIREDAILAFAEAMNRR